MGLFGSKKKTYVGTTVVRAIEDKNLPDSIKSGLFQGLQADGGNLPDYIMEELFSSIGRRAERAYNYAKRSYPPGLPFAQTLVVTMGDDEAQTVLQGIEGVPVDIEYCNLAPANLLHFGWSKLVSTYGYNQFTNEIPGLTAIKGFPVYLEDLVPTMLYDDIDIFNMDAIEFWGTPATTGPTPDRLAVPSSVAKYTPANFVWRALADLPYDHIQLFIAWEDDKKEIHKEKILLTVDPMNDDADYVHVKYMVGEEVKYFTYAIGTGTYPILDGLIDLPNQTVGEYFPFVYFRHAKTPIGDNKDSDIYKAAKRVSKLIGMNYDQIHDSIHENPDIKDVEQAILMFAVPMTTENPLETEYLFEYMRKLYFTQERQYQSSATLPILDFQRSRKNAARNGVVIKDNLFQMAIRHDGIFKRMVVGSIGAVGTCTKTNKKIDKYYTITDGDGTTVSYSERITVYTLRRQSSHAMYEELEIHNPKTVFKVFEQYETIGDDEDSILIIPIDRSITKKYPLREREILYSRGMHYVFNSRVVVKLKWYQTGLFQFILTAVAVILIAYTAGASLQALASGIAAGGAAATVAIVAFLKKVLIGIVLSYAFKLFVKAVGLEAAFLVAILAALMGAYQFLTQGGTLGAPWVQELLQLTTGLSSAVNSVAQDLIGDLLADYSSFLADAEKQMDALEEAQSLLDKKTWLSPFVVFGETPEEFFNRTVHSGNIGVLSIEAVTNYVQVALTLPKLVETLGDSSYG